MIRHSVLFKFRPDITRDQAKAIDGALANFYSSYQGFSVARHGFDLGIRDGNYDYSVSVDFESRELYSAYAQDPAHLELIANFIAPNIVARAAVQFEY